MYFYQRVVFAKRKLPATPNILPPTSENHKSFFSHLEPNKSQKVLDTSIGSHVDYTTLGIMAGLALMFIVICVVLQLFAK